MQHLAIIPDGNRRWARKNKLKSFFGHKHGLEVVHSAIKVCIENSIKYLSFYTFSLENFRRSDFEKRYLFNLLINGSKDQVDKLIENGVRIRFLGDRSLFPGDVLDAVEQLEDCTKHLDTLNLNLLFCYGAKAEILSAVKLLAKRVQDGALRVDQIDDQLLQNSLWTSGMPDPDLIIRTGKVKRLSNFLLYQAAYSEFMFLDYFWPEMTEERLNCCINDFKEIQRNFGK